MLKRLILIVGILALAALGVALWLTKSNGVEAAFTKPKRQRLESVLTTNGRVEPAEYLPVRVEREGIVAQVLAQRGQAVTAGLALAQLDTRAMDAELAAAQARVADVAAQLDAISQGGRQQELSAIDNELRKNQAELSNAERDLGVAARLLEKQAGTRQDVIDAQRRVDAAKLAADLLAKRRASLVAEPDRRSLQARLQEAEAVVRGLKLRLQQAAVVSPLAGTLYQMDLKPGMHLNPGDIVGTVGRLEQVKVLVSVDEPELGRVRVGMPVKITWNALAGREWLGTIARMPTQIVALGNRQVGEVQLLLDNPGQVLLPGTNIDAEIRTSDVPNALTVPKEVVRRENQQDGVYVLQGQTIAWRPVTLGVSSATRVQITAGLTEDDAVMLPTDVAIRPGEPVKAVVR